MNDLNGKGAPDGTPGVDLGGQPAPATLPTTGAEPVTPAGAAIKTHPDDTLRGDERTATMTDPVADTVSETVVTPTGVTSATDANAPAEAHQPMAAAPAADDRDAGPIHAATGKPQVTGATTELALEADGRQASDGDGVRRRDFINIAALSFAGVGGLAVVAPLLAQMAPAADVLALSSTEIDVSAIQPGQAIKTMWRKQPVFVRNLTPAEIDAANKVGAGELRDNQSLSDRTKPGKENWLITLGVCTHLGCVPLGAAEGEAKGDFGGYFCPCHGSHYDTAGRIRKGPAPTNLTVPPYDFTSDTLVTIG